jgi:hypothetical protein
MELNTLKCGTDAKNTGFGDCPFDMSHIRKHIKVPEGKEFTPAEINDFEATLRAGILAPKSERFYPFPNWEQLSADNSEDVQVSTFGYGGKAVGRLGDYDATFDFLDGAYCASKALKSHAGKGRYLLVDDNFRIIGTKVGDNLKGIEMTLIVLKPKLANGDGAVKYSARFFFGTDEIWDNIGFVDKIDGFNPLQLEGLQDVVIKAVSTSTTTAVKVTVRAGCDRKDLGTVFLSLIHI